MLYLNHILRNIVKLGHNNTLWQKLALKIYFYAKHPLEIEINIIDTWIFLFWKIRVGPLLL